MNNNWKVLMIIYYLSKPFLKERELDDPMDKVLEYFEM